MALLQSRRLSEAGFRHGFPDRGTDDRDLMHALGVDRIACADQVHGAGVVEASEAATARADAVIGRSRSAAGGGALPAVGVRVADCVPVLVADPATGDVAAIHAGWRGIVAGVVRAALQQLGRRSVVAAIGPCIGPCCFEVGLDVAEAIISACPGVQVVARSTPSKAMVDLRSAVRGQLRAVEVDDASIEDVVGCTKHEARFHSFRRDGANSGRMLAAIVPGRYF
jgi:polyphenol oxidase